jgi:(1->4)-alpha-D-glucan 1-alpha-D-glucosylmutase
MIKALKEAKENSSWVEPNEEWETATREFVAAILDPARGRRFLRAFAPFAERLAHLGALNSLAQTVLKCTTPGVPDIYQGCEVWDFSLVDPDNRRPVDYAHRTQLLATLDPASPAELLTDWRSGRIKLFVLQRLLQLRATAPALFAEGRYAPLEPTGPHATRLVAFERTHADQRLVVLTPRTTAALNFPATGEQWHDTKITLPPGKWRDIFTNRTIETTGDHPVADLLAELPVACLVRVNTASRNR